MALAVVKGVPKRTLEVLDAQALGRVLRRLPRERVSIPVLKRRYSVTADILSYRRCKRQYGFFSRRGYVSAQSGQLFFGTVIHETLDRAHAHFRGEVEGVAKGMVPSGPDIENYFGIAEKALRARGVRPLSRESRQAALKYVTEFNANFGADVYRRIVDTEHLLQKDKGTYVLHGVVDVIAQTEDADRSLGAGNWGLHEIWDYKGSKRPRVGRQELADYEFQMRVYSHLYELRNGELPRKAVLWFLGEQKPEDQQYAVALDKDSVKRAIEVFEGTVMAIEESIRKDDWSKIKRSDAPSEETCDACDIRWNCPAPSKVAAIRPL